MEFAFQYLYYFSEHLVLAWSILGLLALIIAFLGMVVGMLESWPRFDSVYWAFITATTVGYGDIRPIQGFSKILSILIALIGVTFTGILVALAINSATLSFRDVNSQGEAPTTLSQP
jgi:Ion channel